jgi:outer membrane protein TolC
MLRYGCWPCVGLLLLASGCSVPSARENAAAAGSLIEGRVPVPLLWRRDPAADRAARERAEQLLDGGLTLQESISVSFLASPTLQIALEQLEISRAELVAATRPTNPIAIIGSREPGGDLAVYYPDRTISVGVLQNVISLLSIPDRRAFAKHNLERVRFEVAQQASEHAARVAEAWYRYDAARRVMELYERSLNTTRTALENLAVMAANGEAAANDMGQGRNELFNAEGQVDRAQLDAADTRARLGELLGISGWRDNWELAGEMPPLPATDPDVSDIESKAMERRFDLQAAQKTIDMRLRQLGTQRRFRWLTELEIGVFRDKAIGGTPFTGPNAAIELPLFDQRQAAVLQADAELRTAVRQVEARSLEARRQIRGNALALAAMRRLVERYERDILPNHERMAAELGAGYPGELARLNGRLTMLEAQRQHMEVLRDYWVARSALAEAAGDWMALSGVN